MKKRNAFIFILLVMILATFFSGCGKETDEKLKNVEVQIVNFEKVTPTVQEKDTKDVYVITKVHNSQYWQVLCDGAKQAGENLGCNIFVGGTLNELDVEGQLQLLTNAMEEGADAILLAPIDSNNVYEPIQKIMDEGIPVILVDTIMNSCNFDVCFMTDNMQAGRMVAKDMLEKLVEAGNSQEEALQVGIQIGSRTSQTIIERLAGFYEYWSDYAPKKWTVLEEIYCNEGNVNRAQEMAGEMLDKYPTIKGVIGCNNGSTVGLAKHLKETGKKDVVLVGFDFSDEVAELITEEGYLVSTVVQRQYEMGYEGVCAAVKNMEGNELNYKFVDTQVELVDAKNVEQYVASLE